MDNSYCADTHAQTENVGSQIHLHGVHDYKLLLVV